jgi:G3E family GTPase
MSNTAVIINEFGEIPIDHVLVNQAIENTVVLQNGCICCTIRGDLVDTLLDLEGKRDRGEIPAFDRVAIETTGLADVAPVLQTMLFDDSIAGRCKVESVVATVDAVNIHDQLERFPEVRRQIAFADTIVITKTDLVDRAQVHAVVNALRTLNPSAKVMSAADADAALFDRRAGDACDSSGGGLREWLSADAYEELFHGSDNLRRAHEHEHGEHRHHHHDDRHGHEESIRSFSVAWEAPLDFLTFRNWLLSLTSLRGKQLLRIKGIVAFRQIEGPVVFQGVQHVLYPPRRLRDWPDADHRSRMVFITEGIDPAAFEASMPDLTGARDGA